MFSNLYYTFKYLYYISPVSYVFNYEKFKYAWALTHQVYNDLDNQEEQ